jgi:hypothetical protein
LDSAEKNDTKKLRTLLDTKNRNGSARANFHKNGRRAGKNLNNRPQSNQITFCLNLK